MTEVIRPNIVEVFDHYGLKILGRDNGGWRKAECPKPDHVDQNPSASVNEDDGRWWCHACNEGGDGFDVIRERENLAGFNDCRSFAEATFGEGGTPVRPGSGSSSLLPRASGHRQGRRNWTAPWTRL